MPRALLPPGCYDLLPPHAREESEAVSTLLATFAAYGYEQVSPPLLEYTESLLSGRGTDLSAQVFRVMDSEAQKVMGIRADITLQVARIAESRMSGEPRPLRLSYAGPILRAHGDNLREKRQYMQAGIELIGSASPEADAEVIHTMLAALEAIGAPHITVDINTPGLISLLLADEALNQDELQKLLQAIAHKDIAAVRAMPLLCRDVLAQMLTLAGSAAIALPAVEALPLPEAARSQLLHARKLLELLQGTKASFTFDPAECRGFEYHTGVSFSFFAKGASQEIGRGGRYRAEHDTDTEEATGFTLYVDTLRRLLPATERPRKVYIANGLQEPACEQLRKDGYIIVLHIPGNGDPLSQARLLGCHYLYQNNRLEPIPAHKNQD